MKKLLLVAILMLALVITAVACNNEPADTTASETTVGQVPGTAEPAPETAAPEVPTEAPEVPTEAPEVPTEAPEVPTDAPVTQAPVVTTEPETEAPVDPDAPVLMIGADKIATNAPTGNLIGSADKMTEGSRTFVRLTTAGGDPFFTLVNGAGVMPDYLVVSYRTNGALDGQFFIGSGAGPNGAGDYFNVNWNENGDWNLAIIDLTATGVTSISGNNINYLRMDFFVDTGAAGDYFDVEYVAFFNTPAAAEKYNFEQHKAPMWGESGIVTHLSFDQLYTGTGNAGNGPENFFTPGQSGAWDKIATLPDFSVDTLTFWGWVGVIGEIGQFGYQVNGGAAIYDDAWTFNNPAEGLINHCPAGTDNATRMKIAISLAGLDGENTIRTLYKAADGTEACLAEFTVILPEKPKDIKNTFVADVNANDVGTGLGASDLADYFTVELPIGSEGVVANGEGKMYSMTAISDMYADVNGKYFIQSNNLTSANGFMFVRGYKVVNSDEIIEKFDPAGGFYKINNYYEQDMAGQMGGAGIYARLEGGTLYIMVKYYNAESVTRVGNKIYSLAAEGTELTMADDGEVVSILVNGKTYATIALSGSTTYADINEVQPKNGFAASAVVTLADGRTETIENTLIAETCECQVGVVVRAGHFKFDALKVGAYSAIEIPEMETEEPRENIALNKPVSSDSVENETNLAANATDGDEATRYGALPAGEAKMIVDLEAVYKLSSMKILFENASCEYEIAISVDGVNYTQIHKAAQHGATTLNLKDLNDAEARYIMFHRLPTDVQGSWFSIYEVYAYGEKVAEPEVPSNEIKVSTTDTYCWIDVVEFTANATGNYTFTLPAGLGAWDVYAYDSFTGDPYVDYYANENGAKFTIGLTEGATTTFYVAATTKADWTITWEYTEGEVEPDETEPSDLTTIEPVLGENTVTITAADMEYGAVEGTLTVDKAGQYSIVAADFMAVFYIDGMQQRGSAWLEPGTYDIALVIYAFGPGTYNYTLTVEYPPVPGDEELPFEWTGSLDVTGDHDAWYEYTATESGIWVITAPEGNYVSGLTNFKKVGNAYSVYVAKGDVVKFNLFGNTAGTYTSETVKFVHVSKDELRILDAAGNHFANAFTPGQCDSWNGVLALEENSFGSLVTWGWIAVAGDSFEYFVEINGEVIVSDDFYFEAADITNHIANVWGEGVIGSRFYITIPADKLERGGNLIKAGVIIDGAAHYFWDYTVVVEYDETATDAPAPEVTEPVVTAPAEPEVTEPEEPETPVEPETDAPVVPDEPVIDDTTYGKTTISLSIGGQSAPYSGTKTFGQRYNIGENVLRGIWVYAMATYDDGNVNTWSVKVWQWNGTYADTVAGTPLAVVTGSNHANCQPFSVDISAEYGITGDIYYEIEYLTGSKQFTGWTASGGAVEGVETYVAGELKDGTYIASLTVLDLSKPIDPNGPAHQIGATDIVSAAANGNMVGSAEKLTEGEVTFARLTAAGGDPWVLIANSLGVMPKYLAVSYRTNTTNNGQFFIGSGAGPTGAGDNFLVNWAEGDWAIAIVDLTACGATSITDGNINYLRFDFFTDGGAAGDYMDVEWVAFFDSVEKAETYFAKTH